MKSHFSFYSDFNIGRLQVNNDNKKVPYCTSVLLSPGQSSRREGEIKIWRVINRV